MDSTFEDDNEPNEFKEGEGLSLESFNRMLKQYNILVQENKNDEVETYNNPPVISEEINNDEDCVIPKFSYLRRGSGLARYNMTTESLKKGPPDFYKGKTKKTSQNPRKILPKTLKQPAMKTVKPTFADRKFATTAVKSFDDEVLPAVRRRIQTFEVPIPDHLLNYRPVQPKPTNIPKTPMKKLVLRQEAKELEIFEKLEQRVEESDFSPANSSVQKLLNPSEDDVSPSQARKELFVDPNRIADIREFPGFRQEKRNGLDRWQGGGYEKAAEPNSPLAVKQPSQRAIAEAMKRKGLTDHVKTHLNWVPSPRRKRPVCYVKKIRIKKKPVKHEKVNLCELQEKFKELELVKNQLKLENDKMKKLEKDYLDEKINLDKERKKMTNYFKEEEQKLVLERERLAEDQKKFRREKMSFEKHWQENRNQPNREERELIRNLKLEVETLKETAKTREARVGANQAQLRNRIVVLEKEKKELMEELAIARKVQVKKVAFQSEGQIKSKVIDAINNKLGKHLKCVSARGRPLVRQEPPKRSRSAGDTINKTRAALPNAAPDLREDSPIRDESDDEPVEDVEVIDMVGNTNISDRDSGLGSRASSHCDPSSRQLPEDAPVLEQLRDLKRRMDCLLISNAQKADHPVSNKTSLPEPNKTQCDGGDKLCNGVIGNRPFEWAESHNIMNISEEDATHFKTTSSRLKEGGICRRHDLAVSSTQQQQERRRAEDTTTRDVIRTVLCSGDVEEEELLTGVRRLWCHACGACEITYRNRPGYRRTVTPRGDVMEELPDGTREWRYTTGELVRTFTNGDKLLILPNGERELSTRAFKKLERPDGTIRTVFADGKQETRYPNGQVIKKDRYGHVIMDSGGIHPRHLLKA